MEKLRKNTAALEKKQKKSFFNFALCFRNVFYTDVIAKVFRQKILITKNIVPLCAKTFFALSLWGKFFERL